MKPPVADTDPRDGLLAGIDDVLTPFALWAAHFAFCYVWLAVTCRPTLADQRWAGVPLADAGIAAASVAVLAAFLARFAGTLRARRRARRAAAAAAAAGAAGADPVGGRVGGLPIDMRLGSALLAAIATLWTTVPMLLVAACAA